MKQAVIFFRFVKKKSSDSEVSAAARELILYTYTYIIHTVYVQTLNSSSNQRMFQGSQNRKVLFKWYHFQLWSPNGLMRYEIWPREEQLGVCWRSCIAHHKTKSVPSSHVKLLVHQETRSLAGRKDIEEISMLDQRGRSNFWLIRFTNREFEI